jgi:hypothetical protein
MASISHEMQHSTAPTKLLTNTYMYSKGPQALACLLFRNDLDDPTTDRRSGPWTIHAREKQRSLSLDDANGVRDSAAFKFSLS